MSHKDAEGELENAITGFERETGSGAALLTGWVVVAEFMDPDGTPRLETWAAEGMPYWRINGMINAASDEVFYLEEYDDE
jgi:hypothetical protein